MRRVAREVGVEAMSLYHYVRDREDLLDGLAEAMVRSGLPTPVPKSAETILTGFAAGIRATALAHPEAFHLVGLRPLRSPDATAAITNLLHALEAAGMTPARAVLAYRTTAAYARGFALSEIAGLTYGPGSETTMDSGLRPFAKALQRDTADTFAAGLRALVAGLTRGGSSALRDR